MRDGARHYQPRARELSTETPRRATLTTLATPSPLEGGGWGEGSGRGERRDPTIPRTQTSPRHALLRQADPPQRTLKRLIIKDHRNRVREGGDGIEKLHPRTEFVNLAARLGS